MLLPILLWWFFLGCCATTSAINIFKWLYLRVIQRGYCNCCRTKVVDVVVVVRVVCLAVLHEVELGYR